MSKRIIGFTGILIAAFVCGGCDKVDSTLSASSAPTARAAAVPQSSSLLTKQIPAASDLAQAQSIDALKVANSDAIAARAAATKVCLDRLRTTDGHKALVKRADDLRDKIRLHRDQNLTASLQYDWSLLTPILSQISRMEADAINADSTAMAATGRAAEAAAAYASAVSAQDAQRRRSAEAVADAQMASALVPSPAMPPISQSQSYGVSEPSYSSPSYVSGSAKSVHVDGYTRKDGTHVNSYNRSEPHSTGGGSRRR